jgi:predicted ATPase
MKPDTCEKYVLQELERLQLENEELKQDRDDYRRMYNQSETEVDKLRMQLREAQELIKSYQDKE